MVFLYINYLLLYCSIIFIFLRFSVTTFNSFLYLPFSCSPSLLLYYLINMWAEAVFFPFLQQQRPTSLAVNASEPLSSKRTTCYVPSLYTIEEYWWQLTQFATTPAFVPSGLDLELLVLAKTLECRAISEIKRSAVYTVCETQWRKKAAFWDRNRRSLSLPRRLSLKSVMRKICAFALKS